MLKPLLSLIFFTIQLYYLNLQTAAAAERPDLVIYSYDSFSGVNGLGRAILPAFEKKHSCKIKNVSVGDAGQLLSRLELDARRPEPSVHLIIGLDQNLWVRAKRWLDPWKYGEKEWVPQGYHEIDRAIWVENGFLPMNFGIFAWLVDRTLANQLQIPLPKQLTDLTRKEYRRNLLLQDPRTSTPGLSFLLYTHALLKESTWDFWKSLQTQWLTLTPGWEGSYQLFLRQEAPFIWSYLSSLAYQEENKGKNMHQYEAILFEEGQPVQIEGAAIVKGALKTEREKRLARLFLEYLISDEVQVQIPKKNWMMPVKKGTSLPESFKKLPHVKYKLLVHSNAEVDRIVGEWNKTMR